MWSSLVPSCSDRWMHAAGKGTCAGDGNGDRALGPVAYTRLFTFLFRTEASGTWKARNHLLVEENLWRTGKSGTFWLLQPITLILKDHYQRFFLCVCECVYMHVQFLCMHMCSHAMCMSKLDVCRYVYTFVCMPVCAYAICVYTWSCVHVCVFTCYMHVLIWDFVHAFVCMFVHMLCPYICVRFVYMQACTCVYVHVCMHSADFTLCCSSSVPCAHSLSL